MEMATLGKTGLKVSRLGVGLASLQDLSVNEVERARRLLNEALDAGINFLDTAECYGLSEEFIGKTVAHRRHEFVLATKTGHASGDYSGAPWTAEAVRHSIEQSLMRMKTDYVDLVQVHAYNIEFPPPDGVIDALLEAKRDGKTRFVGYSQENEHAKWAVQTGLFDTLQTSFNLVDQRARYRLFELAKQKGMGLIMKRPIANSVWGRDALSTPYSSTSCVWELLRRAKEMAALGPIEGAPDDPIELALGFVLAHEEADTAVLGTANPDHMLANIDIAENSLTITEEVVEELHRRFDLLGKDWPSLDSPLTKGPSGPGT